jgi:hypothetical protein
MNKPQPRVTEVSKAFWDGVDAGRLLLQRCLNADCRRVIFYPRVCCPYCKGADLEWIESAGRGRIITHTTVHRVHHDGFVGEAPYVFAAVEVDGGAVLYGQVLGAPTDGTPLIGQPVAAEAVPHGPQRRLVAFRLAAR